MKTNQVMIRPMAQFKVSQRTKDGFFCASDLMRQWNEANASKKNINHYLDLSSTKEFFQAIIDDDVNIRDSEKPMNHVVVKSSAKTDKRGKRTAGEVWLNPIAFLDFAMWLNPSFKVQVIKFVYDQMIEYRNQAGNAYRELGQAVNTIVNRSFMPIAMSKIAEAINHCVFGSHEKSMRNQRGEEVQQKELWQFERKLTDLINEGFLTSFQDVMEYLRKMWRKKYTPKALLGE